MKKGWRLQRLGDVCRIDRRQSRHKGLPYVGLEHIEGGTGKFIGSLKPMQVKSNTFAFDAKSVLFGRLRPYLKKVLLPSFEGHCSTEIFPLQPSATLIAEYLHYWFLQDSVITAIDATCTGARMPRADMDAVMDFPIPVPPLPEQRRIVAILDEAFEGITAAKANAERNLKNAREVFEGELHQVMREAAEIYGTIDVGEISDFQNGFAFKSKTFQVGECTGTKPVLRISNVQENQISLERMVYVQPSDYKEDLSRYEVKPGDLVIAMSGGTTGKVGLNTTQETYLLNQRLGLFRPRASLEKRFLYWFLRSKSEQNLSISAGSAQPNLSTAQIKALSIPKLSNVRQNGAIVQLDKCENLIESIVGILLRKLTALDELKASLLHQAFTGNL